MACPTCDHEMGVVMVAQFQKRSLAWCPRCGTTVMEKGDGKPTISPPMLVERAREYVKLVENREDQTPTDDEIVEFRALDNTIREYIWGGKP